jgi:hypothetical protein
MAALCSDRLAQVIEINPLLSAAVISVLMITAALVLLTSAALCRTVYRSTPPQARQALAAPLLLGSVAFCSWWASGGPLRKGSSGVVTARSANVSK